MIKGATVSSKGQITIPKPIRESLGLKEGKKVVFILEKNEAVMVPEVENPVEELKELRNEMKLSVAEIRQMMSESKKEWSKFQ